jgi:hypothetical protein
VSPVLDASTVNESIGSAQCVTRVSVPHDGGGARRREKLVASGLRPVPRSAAICNVLTRKITRWLMPQTPITSSRCGLVASEFTELLSRPHPGEGAPGVRPVASLRFARLN